MDPCSWTKNDDTHSGSMSCLTLIFWPISLLLYTFRECLTNVASTGIQSYKQSNSISIWPARPQYLLTPLSPSFLMASMSTLLITHLWLQTKSIGLDARATSANAVLSKGLSDSFFSLFFSEIITSFIPIILVCHTLYCRICNMYFFLFVLL